MDGIVATLPELLDANAVLAGGQVGDKYSERSTRKAY
jgi:hypothetical protein